MRSLYDVIYNARAWELLWYEAHLSSNAVTLSVCVCVFFPVTAVDAVLWKLI